MIELPPELTAADLALVDYIDARLSGVEEVPEHELERYLWIVAALEEWYSDAD